MTVQVSEHAIDKYIKLVRDKYGINIKSRYESEQSIKELFDQAEKEELHGGLVKRIIDNGFEDSEYYRYENWRIVVHNNVVVTIEEAYLKRRNGIDSQTSYKCRRYDKYQARLRKKRENFQRRNRRKKHATTG